ncbi:aminomethyl-transferring glycine dehydrogenase subunit GcvPA [Eubacteriales bacterium OttesenSCG-928-M02]|nr:aminomethyl-transferring glycine dehydrogenase subunit GcvPA [Eubacteriales bacterium OttesenSCG-928-M02]
MTRYIPHTKEEQQQMLWSMGMESMDELYQDIPEEIKLDGPLPCMGEGMSELELIRHVESLAKQNTIFPTIFRGAGAYRHFIPSVVKNVTARNEFVTAYTPYQAETSQGLLQAIFEYQTMISELTGLPISNASLYDGATAAMEAANMCLDRKRKEVIVFSNGDKDYNQIIRTFLTPQGGRVITIGHKDGLVDMDAYRAALNENTACVYFQYPNFFGQVEDAKAIIHAAHGVGAKAIVGANPIALALYASPGALGADICVGEGQPLGMPLSFGGPYLGFIACEEGLMRKIPGRIVGQTVDNRGQRAFVLTLQAREQHIRRERASSAICSNQALCALTAHAYLTAMGPKGLYDVASQCYNKAHYLQKALLEIGFAPSFSGEFFHEFVTECPVDAAMLEKHLAQKGMLMGLPVCGKKRILWCVTEMVTVQEMDALIAAIKEVL